MHGSKTVAAFWLANCFGKPALLDDVLVELFQLVADGKLKPIIGATYPLDQATDAHRDMLGRSTTGKIVLKP
jgi:NADPH2:quinone reductase